MRSLSAVVMTRKIALAGLGLVLLVGAARADQPAADRESRRRKEYAVELATQAKKKYDLAEWTEALALYQSSYESFEDPPILFNICQVRRKLGEFDKAIETCKAFLRNLPNAPNRVQVERLIDTMERQLAALQNTTSKSPPQGPMTSGPETPDGSGPDAEPAEPAEHDDAEPDATPAPAPLRERRRWYSDTWGLVITGAGVAIAGVGVGLLVNASGLRDDADSTLDAQDVLDLRAKADSRGTIGAALAIGGGVVVIAGIVKLVSPNYRSAPDSGEARNGRRLRAVVSPSFVGLGGTF